MSQDLGQEECAMFNGTVENAQCVLRCSDNNTAVCHHTTLPNGAHQYWFTSHKDADPKVTSHTAPQVYWQYAAKIPDYADVIAPKTEKVARVTIRSLSMKPSKAFPHLRTDPPLVSRLTHLNFDPSVAPHDNPERLPATFDQALKRTVSHLENAENKKVQKYGMMSEYDMCIVGVDHDLRADIYSIEHGDVEPNDVYKGVIKRDTVDLFAKYCAGLPIPELIEKTAKYFGYRGMKHVYPFAKRPWENDIDIHARTRAANDVPIFNAKTIRCPACETNF